MNCDPSIVLADLRVNEVREDWSIQRNMDGPAEPVSTLQLLQYKTAHASRVCRQAPGPARAMALIAGSGCRDMRIRISSFVALQKPDPRLEAGC